MTADLRILCYGDSNTWGVDLERDCRLGKDERWTGLLAAALGEGATVIEEGLGGRTTVRDDPYEPHRNGIAYLAPCLMSHDPLDVVVIMLGTNDLKRRFATNAEDIARGVGLLCATVKSVCAARPVNIVLVSPAPFGERVEPEEMWQAGIAESHRLAPRLAELAAKEGAAFLDAGSVCRLDHGDGIHLDRGDHRALATALHQVLLEIPAVAEALA